MPETRDNPEELSLVDASAMPAGTSSSQSLAEGTECAQTADVRESAKESEAMLDVHPARHAAGSWKEFSIHIATIVLGLLIALCLEQTVEYFHHRREVAQVREELRDEREANKRSFTKETNNWRWETAELENNLMVLDYMQKHPGTVDEKLPGSLVWSHDSAPRSQAVWDAAKNSGVASLMSREEVERYEDTYNQLKKIDDARALAWEGMNDAARYEFKNIKLSHLSAAQIDEITTLTEIALTRHWLEGVALENTARKYSDFPRSITTDELDQVRHRKSLSEAMHDPSFALSISRMKAAGYEP
jgi:hypothetical protein